MRVIVIGAGRGRRLMPTTADAPKCFAEVAGKRLLDWAVEAFRANGLDRVCFIGGYQIEKVKEAYPQFTFRHNPDWEHNNILASLFYAADLMDEPFICCYSDVLFTPDIIARLANSPDDMVLGVDTAWLERYASRTEHPPDDAEKVTVANGRVTRVDRQIPAADAYGEYIGVAKFSAAGAARLREHYIPRRRKVRRPAVARCPLFRKRLQDSVVPGHDRTRRAIHARRYAGRLHRSRYATGFRVRAATLDHKASREMSMGGHGCFPPR